VSQIQSTTVFSGVDPSNVPAFESLIREAYDLAADEPGTLMYDWYRGADGASFIAREVFADSGAVLAHAANVGSQVEQWIALSDSFTVELFGVPSQELQDAIAALGPVVHPPALG
jgi:quinol monooxygenase YgiN